MINPSPAPEELTRSPDVLAALCELWQGSNVWITLNGRSMMPTIRPGSRLRLRCEGDWVMTGGIIAYRRGPSLIVHRLVGYVTPLGGSESKLVCRGDGNARADAPIEWADVVGVVVEVQPPRFRESVRQMLRSLTHRMLRPRLGREREIS